MSLYSHYHNCPFRQRKIGPFGGCATTFATVGSVSLDSQAATVPLRIQFAGVTPVPLPPPEELGTLWVFSSLLDDTKGKRREACSAPLHRVEVRRSRIGGGERSEPDIVMLFLHMKPKMSGRIRIQALAGVLIYSGRLFMRLFLRCRQ